MAPCTLEIIQCTSSFSPVTVSAQIQPISTGDLRKLDALNVQGVTQKVYINGILRGLQRIARAQRNMPCARKSRSWSMKSSSRSGC